MENESCLLRRLTLCDGQVAAEVPPRRGDTACWCECIDEAQSRGLGELATAARIERARVLKHADEIVRIRRWRPEL